MKKLLLLLLFGIPLITFAQERDRIVIEGTITAKDETDVEGINIYNISSEKGTISNEQGTFKIAVGLNDRVLISALQFQDFTIIVSEKELTTKKLSLYLNANVNRLDEVLVRTTDLTGNLDEDVKRIKTSVFVPEWNLSYETLEFGYQFERDAATKVDGNASLEALNHNAMPMASVDLGKLAELFFPRKRATPKQTILSKKESNAILWDRYDPTFISQTFDIPLGKVDAFIYYAEENGLSKELLEPKNEIRLLAYLFSQSAAYKQSIEAKD